ncbi:fibronectin-binding protein A N-terminus-domain-containing protein [Durotheca rogersii]|uniref:fibronectin-binding protein A N-terminus-domain-containing protein n=1 Tax=Durotheca rogersii TaxID=419775 RepID=UPI00222016F3|nr:fibronectin-binding protein A N-terminus-domain-containing protein [Durotheca rogersii]KAI5867827.1 fibronectin-binding protein A N-terminus-domain-containing protein [Durotheca rogersii]
MKQRFSSLDVKVISHELSANLVPLRVSNIYDLSSKILLFKFSKPGVKKQLLIDSGFRTHLTEFARTTAAAPSDFVQKLRKALKTRRVTAVSQIGTDRIIEFQFSDGQYRLYLEFFASGNVILTNSEHKILTLLRHVPEGEGQEPQRPGLTYSLENRQNFSGIPALTKERLRNALRATVDKAAASATAGKKIKKKPGDELRKGLATTITEFPPILVDHALNVTSFDSTLQPSAVLENEGLLDDLLRSLEEARKIVKEITSSDSSKGYILAKTKPGVGAALPETSDGEERQQKDNLLYEDFHPFLPRQFEQDPAYTVLTFDNFNKMVDEFFSSVEGQKLESRLSEREADAKRKLDAAKADHAKRIEGLQAVQQLNIRKANAIEANVERVQEAIDAVNGLIQQGMDWEDIGKLVERERQRNNPVALVIQLPLKLHNNTITVLLGEAEEDEEEDEGVDASDTDSSVSDSGFYSNTDASSSRGRGRRLAIDVDLGLSPYGNAREYYGERKVAAVKEQKTVQQSETALKNAEQKIAAELKKGLKQEKPVLQPIRKQLWFEKFTWFISSDGYLVLGGKDAQQNEMLYRRYLKKGDVYVHADFHGAPSVIIKNSPNTPDAPIPPSTLSQAGSLAICASSAWDSKAVTSAWWVNADQVSKLAPTGEFLGIGSFIVQGKKNFLPPTQLLLGFALMFKISEESAAKHVRHRLYDRPENITAKKSSAGTTGNTEGDTTQEAAAGDDESDSGDSAADQGDSRPKDNPLQPTARQGQEPEGVVPTVEEDIPIQEVSDLIIAEEAPTAGGAESEAEAEAEAEAEPELELESAPASEAGNEQAGSEATAEAEPNPAPAATTNSPGSEAPSRKSTPQPQASNKGQQPPKRGRHSKAKKIAAKYKDQDDEDRAAIEELTGAAAGRRKAEAEARARAEREAQREAAAERRRAQQERQRREVAKHEEARRRAMMPEVGGAETEAETAGAEAEEETAAELALLDGLVGSALPGDEILEAVAVCGPYAALGRCKYKVKLQPGTQKKGKAVREVVEAWKAAAARRGAVDEAARDRDRMWPREVQLLGALKPEELVNVVPVGKLRVMLSSAGGGPGGSKAGGGGGASADAEGKGKSGKKR